MNYDFRLMSSHSNGVARVGEKVIFIPWARGADSSILRGKLQYRVFRNVQPAGEGELDLSEREPHVVCESEEPAYVQYTFEWRPENGLSFVQSIGVIFEPESMKPACRRPDDFNAFWNKQLDRLAAVPFHVNLTPLDCRDFNLYDLSAECVGNVPVSGELAVPRGKGKYPAVILLQGAGVRNAGTGYGSRLAARGMIALDVNAHGLPNGEPPEFYSSQRGLDGYTTRGMLSGKLEDVYMGNMFLRVKRAIDAVCTLKEWDGEHLFVSGASQGAWQSIAGAYLDPRVNGMAVSIPAGCDLMRGGWPFTGMPESERLKYAANAPYFDAAHFMKKVHCPLVVHAGLADSVCRADGVAAAFNACPSTHKNLTWSVSMEHAFGMETMAIFDRFFQEGLRK